MAFLWAMFGDNSGESLCFLRFVCRFCSILNSLKEDVCCRFIYYKWYSLCLLWCHI